MLFNALKKAGIALSSMVMYGLGKVVEYADECNDKFYSTFGRGGYFLIGSIIGGLVVWRFMSQEIKKQGSEYEEKLGNLRIEMIDLNNDTREDFENRLKNLKGNVQAALDNDGPAPPNAQP